MILLVVGAVVFWGAVFFVFFQADGRSIPEFLWGELEKPPFEVGIWHEIAPAQPDRDAPGSIWERRFLMEKGALIEQVRTRAGPQGPILQVYPERRLTRRRRRRVET